MIYPNLILSLTGFVLAALMLLMFFTSIIEKRRKAALKALMVLPFTLALSAFPFFINEQFNWLIISLDAFIVGFGVYLLIPRFLFKKKEQEQAKGNIDERTIMFARCELKPDTERYESYYSEFPEHKANDEKFRQLPGLLSEKSTFYHPLSFEASDAIFKIVGGLHQHVDGSIKDQENKRSAKEYGVFLKKWAKKSGVTSIGFTKMQNYHWYSIGGRGNRYGQPVQQKHETGIAFTVEMDHEMVEAAPKASIIMESATQYLQSGIIATQLAQFIRNCGYEARAHIDGNYQVVAPLVARDANLGEIGRMGLLMTPGHGPRVRVGVVTTNMPLEHVKRKHDHSFEDFCDKCLKCAVNCPASAISSEGKEEINGLKRWQINSEKCFNYWCSAGTDCGRCMSTCPYSHPNNLLHNLVRWSIRQFPNFRYWAVKMDDFFYGRKSAPSKLPKWMRI